MEDAGIRFVERRRRWFRVGDGLVNELLWGLIRGELDAAVWVKGVDRVDYAGDGKDGRQIWIGNGVLQDERGFDSALPETCEKHEEEAELSQEKCWPYAWLSEHVH